MSAWPDGKSKARLTQVLFLMLAAGHFSWCARRALQ